MFDVRVLLICLAAWSGLVGANVVAEDAVDSQRDEDSSRQVEFNRDVRPILSDRCFLCHGPDRSSEHAKDSDLRLDDRDSGIDYGIFFDDVSVSPSACHLPVFDIFYLSFGKTISDQLVSTGIHTG